MTIGKHTTVGLGELLWDILPSGKQLGGAPANFAYITNLLGDRGIPASRIGRDSLGAEALQHLSHLNLSPAFVQQDPIHPTGTVNVAIDASGQPRFEISESVAWDFLEWTSEWQQRGKSRCGRLRIIGATLRSKPHHDPQLPARHPPRGSPHLRREPPPELLLRASPGGVDEASNHRQTESRRTSKDHASVQPRPLQRGRLGAASAVFQ
jgi:hypothetical protein